MMIRRHNNKSNHRRDHQQYEEGLLAQERVPILSDDVSDSPESDDVYSAATKKKGGWRSRIFGGGTRATPSRSAGRPVSASQNRNLSRTKAASSIDGRGQSVAVRTRTPHQKQQRHPKEYDAPELKASSSSSSTGTGGPSSSRSSAPVRSRPERRDDDNNNKGTMANDPPEQSPSTLEIPRSQSVQSHHGRTIAQLSKSRSHMSETSGRSIPTASPSVMPSQSRSPAAPNGLVHKVLKRPFGREAVQQEDQMWIVLISPAEWESEESVWKYRVHIQKRTESGQEEILQDLTNNMTVRSLADFYWLEKSLQAEFHGALLIPSLSICLGVPDLENCQHEVDARLLTNWLSDILNGIRGQGEWTLTDVHSGQFPIDWQACESMEAFMYRADLEPTSDALNSPEGGGVRCLSNPESVSCDNVKWDDGSGGNILKWVMTGEMCGISSNYNPADDVGADVLAPPRPNRLNLPLYKQKVSSRALADARSLNIQDSFVDSTPTFNFVSTKTSAQYATLLQAEQELVWSWRTQALTVMEKLRIVQNEEKHIAAAWKRFAISISNLFAYEKEIESARLGDGKGRKDLQMPHKKLQKSTVEDVLRVIAKQKVERCTPSLEFLETMLSAYVADLSSIQPAVTSYFEALQHLSNQVEHVEQLREAKPEQPPTSSLSDQIQAGLDQVKKQLVAMSDESESVERTRAAAKVQQAELQLQKLEHRVRENEQLLQDYLTRLCRSVPVRSARMAFAFIQAEMKQTGAMHAAAVNVRSRISVASKDAMTKMIHRHMVEIKEDRTTELQLVQRMVNLGSYKKFSKTDDGTVEVERGIEINKDMENRKGELRGRAIEMCQGRIGRWDSKVAMAIMEAVGVQDANVRVEETTRDLRLIRKFAIGLRENVQRCVEALEVLRMSILQGGFGDIRDLRHDMMWEMQNLFSGTYQPNEQPKTPLNTQVLIEQGIQLGDPLGWRRKDVGCGGAAKAYLDMRESGTEWLLDTLNELLKEYNYRVETVESFVYMECVGIQLEKHFSNQRATALAAFEKKTDISSAINIATRKRMPVLVKELQAKLEAVGPDVSHTNVKEAKEAHLESKALKQELHDLSMRQLARARETSTERAIALMTLWSKEEETVASVELDLLRGFAKTVELSISVDDLKPYLEASPRIPS